MSRSIKLDQTNKVSVGLCVDYRSLKLTASEKLKSLAEQHTPGVNFQIKTLLFFIVITCTNRKWKYIISLSLKESLCIVTDSSWKRKLANYSYNIRKINYPMPSKLLIS